MAFYVVQLRFDLAASDRRMEVRPAHREYLTELKAAGKLVAAGPFTDQTGALLVYDVADEAELRDILAKDPYTPANVYELATLAEWEPLFPIS
ncbi:YciI family protein [Kribbella sp. NBC_01484]|uniref:YciI family protein n=1 Tax=Kribbella sp. NBC_01484 TaxID=2903579 RepID=UPI002E34B053|nr:muconolactone Delta-isomerase family protein [Kribbella sp. NBC_01484]